jgi:O-antigen/teichoic acid export membrane protein
MLSKFYMAMSIAIRMAVGLLVFTMLARELGPREFGFVALVFGYASLGSLLTDFGLSLKALRDLSVDPANGRSVLRATLRIKAVLSAVVMSFGAVAVLLLPIDASAQLTSVMLAAGVMAASFGDLLLVALRARNRFGRECLIVSWTSAVYCAVLMGILHFGGGVAAVSVGFLGSRLLYAGVAWRAALRGLPPGRRPVQAIGLRSTMLSTLPWAMLTNLSYVNGQIDTMMISTQLGLHDVGVYQAGVKFAMSAITFASVIVNTQVPMIVAAAARGESTLRLEAMAWLQMVGAGLATLVGLLVLGPLIARYLIGPEYSQVDELWLGFGVLALLRFVSSALLVSLVAHARMAINVAGEGTTTLVAVALLVGFVPRYGLDAVPWLMSIATAANIAVLVAGRVRLAAGFDAAPSGAAVKQGAA